jgi:hypothetical protein
MAWLLAHTKSILLDKKILLQCTQNDKEVDIVLHIKAIELDYGPVIHLTITPSIPYKNAKFQDHPFMFVDPTHIEEGQIAENLDDTPAVRSLIEELCGEPRKLYAGTWDDHCKRIIKSLTLFWS